MTPYTKSNLVAFGIIGTIFLIIGAVLFAWLPFWMALSLFLLAGIGYVLLAAVELVRWAGRK